MLGGKLKSFLDDESGVVTAEWMVATAAVVMFAVPVVSLVTQGGEQHMEPVAESLEEQHASRDRSYRSQDGGSGGGSAGSAGSGSEPSVRKGPYNGPGTDMGVGTAGGGAPASPGSGMGVDTGLPSSGGGSGGGGFGGGGSGGGSYAGGGFNPPVGPTLPEEEEDEEEGA